MAIDTAKKRRSAAMSRRLPFLRRILIDPDGTIDQADRQQMGFVYRGILALVGDSYIAGTVTAEPRIKGTTSIEVRVGGTSTAEARIGGTTDLND